MQTQYHELVVVGGSLGGVAAAIGAARAGAQVALLHGFSPFEGRWIGGQITAQAVSALDEHPLIEQFGGTSTYNELRAHIRAKYRRFRPQASAIQVANPGGGWVSRLCFRPRDGLQALHALLRRHAPRLTLIRAEALLAAEMRGEALHALIIQQSGAPIRLCAAFFLDASDTGELLPMTETAYVKGAEARADTHEHDAPDQARPSQTQSFTFGFVMARRAIPAAPIPAPQDLARWREQYTFTLRTHEGGHRTFPMFTGELPFWTYRRIWDGAAAGGDDLALINWASNDYCGGSVLDVTPDLLAERMDEARRLALGFAHWLQTDSPRDDGGQGHPELALCYDQLGTHDGLSQAPYIRESRRITALRRITAHDIARADHPDQPSTRWPDSVGIGWYAMDLHACAENPHVSVYAPTLPFQIPVGALIPPRRTNLLAACKNIGTTHLSSGAYRVHPVEWAIGEAAGTLAAFCSRQGIRPQDVHFDVHWLRLLQDDLLARGVPLAWIPETPYGHPDFVNRQRSALETS